ncbi:MAG: 23S rRNA (adenine(2503)-C(2))-methyltransferase RlmN, partial [Clostridia bacterium]|nr:23S rRNA (adenine(2503)-C(2))-methyltransferase RlmN [Clostridia bacterium]
MNPISIDIKSMTIPELENYLKELGQPKFRAKQIFGWLANGVTSFDEMGNVPKSLRSSLKEAEWYIG